MDRSKGYHRDVASESHLQFGGDHATPGFGRVRSGVEARVKWLGGTDEAGPWIYHVERRAGEVIPPHRHHADRVEYILEGTIEWHEADEAVAWYRDGALAGTGERYVANSLTWVPAGRVYGYRIIEDTRLLLWFGSSPGGTDWAT